jgi:multiple sugar transport system ATP-binding protein
VAMGRAIVRSPQVFLMDEPLSNLDAKLRVQTRSQIAALQRRLGVTTVYVTHDQVEAMTMGDRVAVLKDGILQQVDTPRNLYDQPANAFVAGFIGSPAMNLRNAKLVNGGAQLGNVVLPLQSNVVAAAKAANLTEVTLGLRPESFTVARGGHETIGGVGASGLKIEVKLVEELGADAFVYGELPGDEPHEKPFNVRFDGRVPPRIGDTMNLDVQPNEEHVFHPETGERLG